MNGVGAPAGPGQTAGAGQGPRTSEEAGVGAPAGPGQQSLRFRYTKLGKIRFTSQRDVARMWERAFRRIGLPVAWSEGFSPRPLLSFGLALPTGAESLGEYLDVRLDGPLSFGPEIGVDLGELCDRLSGLLPGGLTVQAAAFVPDDGSSLQQEVSSCCWDLEVFGLALNELAARVERLLDAPSVVVRRVRKGRSVEDDLRPAVRTLTVLSTEGAWQLRAEVATQPRGVRPGELLEGLGAGLELARACRRHQWIERDGTRWEPLDVGPGTAAPHAQGRAS
ncbi:MAG TPA: TIGR03936 family radical SAM-associated protein [Acidimicrobiales bacterium]|nr:TIGR03936 family radical SAM-associated protein [Acidimicrobiales bacterium]